MYSSTELAKMFKTTTVTINRKFKDKSLTPYLVKTRSKNNGKIGYMLKLEGLNQFQLLMSESKVIKNVVTQDKDVYKSFSSANLEELSDPKKEVVKNVNNNFQDEYIQNLKEQIKKQDDQIEHLKNQIEKKDDVIEKHVMLVEYSQKLLAKSQEKLLLIESKKNKNWFQKIFGKN